MQSERVTLSDKNQSENIYRNPYTIALALSEVYGGYYFSDPHFKQKCHFATETWVIWDNLGLIIICMSWKSDVK